MRVTTKSRIFFNSIKALWCSILAIFFAWKITQKFALNILHVNAIGVFFLPDYSLHFGGKVETVENCTNRMNYLLYPHFALCLCSFSSHRYYAKKWERFSPRYHLPLTIDSFHASVGFSAFCDLRRKYYLIYWNFWHCTLTSGNASLSLREKWINCQRRSQMPYIFLRLIRVLEWKQLENNTRVSYWK